MHGSAAHQRRIPQRQLFKSKGTAFMKKILVAAAFVAYASSALANIATTKHDFVGGNAANVTAYGTAATGTTSCQFCHTPHKASATMAAAPLWNRADLGAAVQFTMYDQTKVNGNVSGTPGQASLTCLACHEGSAAIGQTLTSTGNLLTGGAGTLIQDVGMMKVGTNLNDDHPVAVLYPVAGVAGKFPAGTATAVASFTLYSSRVECATCHDPHDQTNGNFLRAPAAGLCAECHLDK